MSTPSIPGVDPIALADEYAARIAAKEARACTTCGAKYDKCPECAADDAYEKGRKDAACEREHADEWEDA